MADTPKGMTWIPGGDAFAQRDAATRTFDYVFTREEPVSPNVWTKLEAQPVPEVVRYPPN